MAFIKANGVNFYYEVIGNDASKPTMVFFPGGPGFGCEIYKKQLEPFQSDVNILLFDPRGCGQSEDTSVESGDYSGYTMKRYIDDAHALVRELQQQQKIPDRLLLHGSSYGSMAALGFTVAYPELVDKLVIVTGAANSDFIKTAKRNLLTVADVEQQAVCQQYLWPGQFDAASLKEYFRQTAPLYSHKTTEKVMVYDTSFCNHRILNASFKSEYDHFRLNETLGQISCPVSILFGRHDWITPWQCGQEIKDAIGDNAVFHLAQESAHSIHKDEPELYRKVVLDWIRQPVDQQQQSINDPLEDSRHCCRIC